MTKDQIKELQKILKEKRVYFSAIDGDFGEGTKKACYDLLTPKPVEVKAFAEGYKIGQTHVVEVDPLRLRITDERDKRGCDFEACDFFTASFIGHHPGGETYPTTILVSEGMVINNTQPNGLYQGEYAGKGKPIPTFIVYRDGRVDVKSINDISAEKDVWFAVSGLGTLPYTTQGFEGFETSVSYATHRVAIAWHPVKKKVLLIYRPATSGKRMQQSMLNLGCTKGICMDSGGSANVIIGGERIHTTTRRIYAGITW